MRSRSGFSNSMVSVPCSSIAPLKKRADAVGDLLGEPHLMGDHQHGEVVRIHQVFNHIRHFTDDFGIQRRRHFVEQHDLGPHRERPGNRNPLLLPARTSTADAKGEIINAYHVDEAGACGESS